MVRRLEGKHFSIIKSARGFLWHMIPKNRLLQIKLLAWQHGLWDRIAETPLVQDRCEFAEAYRSFFNKHGKKGLELKIKLRNLGQAV